MTVLEGLLQEIQDHPEDNALRLILADWLDDHGVPDSAELIRLQVERARFPPASLEYQHDQVQPTPRERRLADSHRRYLGVEDDFDRGLVRMALTPEGDWMTSRERCLRQGWVQCLQLQNLYRVDLAALAGCPLLGCVRHLEVSEPGASLTASQTATLLDSPHLSSLRRLQLAVSPCDNQMVTALAACRRMPHLVHLQLHRLAFVAPGVEAAPPGEEGYGRLFAALGLARLKRLVLSGQGIEHLVCQPDLAGLEGLELRLFDVAAVWRALADASHLANLRHLVISDDWTSVEAFNERVRILAGSSHLRHLQVLGLHSICRHRLGAAEIRLLAGSPLVGRLSALDLGGLRVGDEGARILAASANLSRLRRLHLNGCAIGPAGARALAESPCLAGLSSLDLRQNPIGTEEARALVGSPPLPDLTHLRLSHRDNIPFAPLHETVDAAVWRRHLSCLPDLRGLAFKQTFLRKKAVLEVARRGVEIVPLLITALSAQARRVRINAASALGRIGSGAPAAIQALVEALGDQEREVRRQAFVALGRIGQAAAPAVPALLATLEADDWGPPARTGGSASARCYFRGEMALALSRIGPGAVPALMAGLNHNHPRVRALTAEALGMIGPDAAAAVPLLQAANEMEALGGIGPAAVPALTESQKDADWRTCWRATKARARIGPALPILTAALNHPLCGVRCPAALALGKLGLPAIPALLSAVTNSHDTVRILAAEALGRWHEHDSAILPALVAAVHDPSFLVFRAVSRVLRGLGPAIARLAVPALAEKLTESCSYTRRAAIEELGQIKAHDEVDRIVGALADKDEWVRRRAAEVLGDLGPADVAVSALTAALADNDAGVREKAAASLRKRGHVQTSKPGAPGG
jgi:uncharacterized protein (TIGR02996 family)